MQEQLDLVECGLRIVHGGLDALDQFTMRGQGLPERQRAARRVENGNVGKRPSNIDRDTK
jgi:hypothetical protein